MEIITSKDNELYKKIKKLKTKKYREEYQLFLAEGWKFLQFPVKPEMIVTKLEVTNEIRERIAVFDCRKIILSDKLFSEVTSQENSQGVILVYRIENSTLNNLSDNIVVLDGVSDPGNLGTIIRVLDAAGFKDLLLTKGSVDCYNEKVVRASMGSIFNLNILYIDKKNLIDILREREYKIIVTALEEDAISYTKLRLKDKNAFIFGNEGNGIERKIIDKADEKIIIPIYGIAESLNVAMATGIVMYSVRERLGIES